MTAVDACTGVQLQAKDGAIVRGRTLEFAQALDSDVIVIPRNYPYTGLTPGKGQGLKWKTVFAVAGANSNAEPYVMDGVNEKGLSGGIFYFPGFTDYQAFKRENAAATLAQWQLLTWILSSFATVAEVGKALPGIAVCDAVPAGWEGQMPLHYIVTDAGGDCIVIEYIGGKLNIYANPSGILTNAPPFQWHLTNLKNYVKIMPQNAPDRDVNSLKISQAGQGSGMLGLPGDYTPPSRFVRAFFFSSASLPRENAEKAAMQVFHILSSFDIPLGTVRSTGDKVTAIEHTQWTSVCDLRNKFFYYRTEHNSGIRVLKLMECDLNASKIIKFKMESMEKAEDITRKLQ
ncbi:MAG: choloylglycine hydrolase family protein [Victivallales bacterium]|nr:choloylglycine hydrolase family protein [Victivallales bacterium]